MGNERIVYVFFGMIATGKSSLARVWADRHGCLYLNSDVVRKELAGVKKESRVQAALNYGIYSPGFTRLTYDELLHRSEMALADDAGCCIVLDASFQLVDERIRLRRFYGGRCRLLFIYCTCSDETVRKLLKAYKLKIAQDLYYQIANEEIDLAAVKELLQEPAATY